MDKFLADFLREYFKNHTENNHRGNYIEENKLQGEMKGESSGNIYNYYSDYYPNGEDNIAKLSAFISYINRNFTKDLIRGGAVKCNGKIITKPSYTAHKTDNFCINLPADFLEKPLENQNIRPNPNIPLHIIYEDEHLAIIDKQAHLTTHPGAGNYENTLVNALVHHYGPEKFQDFVSYYQDAYHKASLNNSLKDYINKEQHLRPGIVHRLDKNTSGLMMVALNPSMQKTLSKMIERKEVTRRYLAICYGLPQPHSGVIETFIARSRSNRLCMANYTKHKKTAKIAITHYKTLEVFHAGFASLVECELQTGRTHQIRLHMLHKNCPIIGDSEYKKNLHSKLPIIIDKANNPKQTDAVACQNMESKMDGKIENIVENKEESRVDGRIDGITENIHNLQKLQRQALHSYSLEFTHPKTGQKLSFKSDYRKGNCKTAIELKNLYESLKAV